jgi:hypothetical protein
MNTILKDFQALNINGDINDKHYFIWNNYVLLLMPLLLQFPSIQYEIYLFFFFWNLILIAICIYTFSKLMLGLGAMAWGRALISALP